MSFKYFFLALAALSAAAAGVSFRSAPEPVESVFGKASERLPLVGEVWLDTPPRGMPSLLVLTAERRTAHVNCIAAPEICTRLAGTRSRLEASVVRLSPSVVWPVTIAQPAYAVMDETLSRARYLEYVEYEGTLWYLWAGLALVFLGFAYWFRKRPLFPVTRRAS